MRVYTGRGDEGRTDLGDRSRVSKTHPRIEAYGTVDEVNSLVGTVRPSASENVDDRLAAVQNDLFTVQAQLADPDPTDEDVRLSSDRVERLETWIDEYDEELPPLDSFVLPSGSQTGASLHHARAVCRRAERRVVALANADDEAVDGTVLTYLNRLSDLLFTMARVVNERTGVGNEHPDY